VSTGGFLCGAGPSASPRHDIPERGADVVSPAPQSLEAPVRQGGPVTEMKAGECRAAMGVGTLEPVEPAQDRRGAVGIREDAEIRRPSGQRGRPDLQTATLEQPGQQAQVRSPARQGVENPGFCVYREARGALEIGEGKGNAPTLIEALGTAP